MRDFPNQEKMTKQEMVDYLKRWHVYWTTMVMRTPLEFRESEEAFNAIRALIEHGPEVSRGFVVNSARAMGVEPDALAMCLEEAGVRVVDVELVMDDSWVSIKEEIK